MLFIHRETEVSLTVTDFYNTLSFTFILSGLISILAFVVPASSVNHPSTLYYSAIALVFMGFFALLIRTKAYQLSKFEKIMMTTWVIYPAFTALDLLFRTGWIWTEFQEPSRFLLVLPIFLMVSRYGVSEVAIRWGVFLGAVVAGGYALYQKQVLGIYRPGGGTSGLIATFGNISLILGVMSVALFQPLWRNQKRWSLVALVALVLGVIGSLASGTKGGWISMPVLCWIAVDLLERPTYSKRFAMLGGFIIAASLVWFFVPFIQDRASVMVPAIYEYFVNGKVADGSAGIRLALWHSATLIFLDNPLFGTGPGTFYVEKLALIDKGLIPNVMPGLSGPHSQIFNSLSESGVFGPVLVYSIYGSFIWYCRSHVEQNKALATTGILMAVGFMDFGLVEVIWDINNAGVFFVIMMVLIAGKLSHDHSKNKTIC
jgi:O-antigen ligase